VHVFDGDVVGYWVEVWSVIGFEVMGEGVEFVVYGDFLWYVDCELGVVDDDFGYYFGVEDDLLCMGVFVGDYICVVDF
jgi:hypothetical protein